MTEWRLRLEDFGRKGWRNRVTVRSSEIEYVGITNRAGIGTTASWSVCPRSSTTS